MCTAMQCWLRQVFSPGSDLLQSAYEHPHDNNGQSTSKGRFPKTISNGNSGNFDLNVLYKKPAAKKLEENTKKPFKKKIVYYQRYKGKSSSIVDALKALGINSNKSNRKKIAAMNGIKNYSGGAMQNTKLLNLLKKGKLIKSK